MSVTIDTVLQTYLAAVTVPGDFSGLPDGDFEVAIGSYTTPGTFQAPDAVSINGAISVTLTGRFGAGKSFDPESGTYYLWGRATRTPDETLTRGSTRITVTTTGGVPVNPAVRYVRTVNDTAPDSDGNVDVSGGGGDVQTVAGVSPDGAGNVPLTAADVGADTSGAAATAQAAAIAAAATDATTKVGTETTRATAAEALKAPLASPTFTGTPAGPTASAGTNTTQLATTAFVLANGAPPTQGVLASRPAATGSRALYWATDTHTLYIDQAASTWVATSGMATPNAPYTVTTDTTMAALDSMVLANAVSGVITITLPSSPTTGALYAVMKSDASANAVTVATGAGVVNGTASIATQYSTVLYIWDGTNWDSIGGGSSSAGSLQAGNIPHFTGLYALTNTLAAVASGNWVYLNTGSYPAVSGKQLQYRVHCVFASGNSGDSYSAQMIDVDTGTVVVSAFSATAAASGNHMAEAVSAWAAVPSTKFLTLQARNATAARGNLGNAWVEMAYR